MPAPNNYQKLLAQMLSPTFVANSAYAQPGNYQTDLGPIQETAFRNWAAQNNVPYSDSPQADYDMRGFYQGLMSRNPYATSGINPNDKRLHFSDYWKTPFHKTFSAESQWAAPGAPSWNENDQLVLPNGQIVFDERLKGPGVRQ